MKTKKKLLAVTMVLICCVSVIWFSGSILGYQRTYEVQPNLSIPEYKTDIVRVIDAYERLMERYMDLTEQNLSGIGTDLQTVIMKLDTIDAKLMELSVRTARIEKVLGIETNKNPVEVNTTIQQSNSGDKSRIEDRK